MDNRTGTDRETRNTFPDFTGNYEVGHKQGHI